MWYIFSLPDPRNKYNKQDLVIYQSIFSLEYVEHHIQSLQKGSKEDQYVFQNLTWSGVYLRSTLSKIILQKLLTLVPLTATRPEVFVTTTTKFISDSYDALEQNLNHMKSLKLKSYPGENVIDCCAAILVDAERLESSGSFNPEHLGYITCVFEDNYDSRFRLRYIQK